MKPFIICCRYFLVLTILTGAAYPVFVTLIGKILFPAEANGELVQVGNQVIGSELIAQSFSDPKYFWPRPSAVKYDSASSGASNQSLTSVELLKVVNERVANGAVDEMRFSSASGLDPDISSAAAEAQVMRVSIARRFTQTQIEQLRELISKNTRNRQLGFFGQPCVNVLKLNLALNKNFGG